MKILIALIAITLLGACKTQEQIQREQMVDNLAIQVKQSQSLAANSSVEFDSLRNQVQELQGKLEEVNYQNQTKLQSEGESLDARIKLLEEKSTVIETELASQKEKISKIQATANANNKYLKDVLKKLEALTSKKTVKKAPQKKLSKYDDAMRSYKKGHYKTARTKLLALLNTKSIKGSKRARVLHNLGMSEHILKKDQNALVYFSKLYSEFPKSNYNHNGLFFMAKSFERSKKLDEAKATLSTLISEFPKSKNIKKAKALLKKL
ncbi:MAG: tetratricopeptide repeat protein [Bacteriovoracaceae bacterium]